MRFKNEKPAMVDVNMTPMIDIVFQLIAFFMVVINFEQTQADERVKLPRDELARPPETARPSKRVINVGFNRNKAGEITRGPFVILPGIGTEYLWPQDKAAFGDALGRIARSLQRDEKLAETVIEIRADSVAPGGIVSDVIDACQQAISPTEGFEKFAFSVIQSGRQNDP